MGSFSAQGGPRAPALHRCVVEREASQNAKMRDVLPEADAISLHALIPVERMYNQSQTVQVSLTTCTGWAQGIDKGRRVGGVKAASTLSRRTGAPGAPWWQLSRPS